MNARRLSWYSCGARRFRVSSWRTICYPPAIESRHESGGTMRALLACTLGLALLAACGATATPTIPPSPTPYPAPTLGPIQQTAEAYQVRGRATQAAQQGAACVEVEA